MDAKELERIEKMFIPNSVTGYNFIGNTGDAVAAVPALVAAVRSRDAEIGRLDSQIDQLALYIIGNVPGEPSQNEGAVDTIIRVEAAMRARLERIEKAARRVVQDADHSCGLLIAQYDAPVDPLATAAVALSEINALRAALKDGDE